jgi:secreted PhoX family phosphatase
MRMLRRGFLTSALSLAGTGAGASYLVCCAKEEGLVGDLLVDPEGILDLPPGYSYRVLERSGDTMSDGHLVGERPDGMACFTGDDDTLILMRNHELDVGPSPEPSVAFDPNMRGGVTRLVLDRETLARKSSNWVLTGTTRNCAGGPSPWGWLSCEETTARGHGYVFVCKPDAEAAEQPQRAPSLGRFKHEAVAVVPSSNVIYLTEDESESCLYRHVPNDDPFVGRLEAMRVVGENKKNLSDGLSVGDRFEVDWVPIADPEGEALPPYAQASEQGAAIVNRGEGIWYFGGAVFFVSTAGGPEGSGQVFRLEPSATGGTLTLIAQADTEASFLKPDNITVSPTGEVFVAEDNGGSNHIHRVDVDGTVTPFARNRLNDGSGELCGVCFSPDGGVMFVNLQEEGITLAISGPFPRA